jgi:hypothetical protein
VTNVGNEVIAWVLGGIPAFGVLGGGGGLWNQNQANQDTRATHLIDDDSTAQFTVGIDVAVNEFLWTTEFHPNRKKYVENMYEACEFYVPHTVHILVINMSENRST